MVEVIVANQTVGPRHDPYSREVVTVTDPRTGRYVEWVMCGLAGNSVTLYEPFVGPVLPGWRRPKAVEVRKVEEEGDMPERLRGYAGWGPEVEAGRRAWRQCRRLKMELLAGRWVGRPRISPDELREEYYAEQERGFREATRGMTYERAREFAFWQNPKNFE